MPPEPQVRVFDPPAELFRAAAEEFCRIGAESISQRGRFSVALSGGSTPKALHRELARRTLEIQQVRMRIDQPRQHRVARQIHDPRSGRCGDVLGQGIDRPASDENVTRREERAVLAVEDAPGVDQSDTAVERRLGFERCSKSER